MRDFYANMGSRSIEAAYQATKIHKDGSTGLAWRVDKGLSAVNMAEHAALYPSLWDRYIAEQPELRKLLLVASGVSDIFGQSLPEPRSSRTSSEAGG